MTSTFRELGIDQLDAEHRLQLIGEIWDSLSAEATPISEGHRQELDRRLDAADSDPAAGQPWSEVLARLRGGQ